jgi:purine-binding chemotaxis protein CheW
MLPFVLLVESQIGPIRVAIRQGDVVEVAGRVHTTPLPGAPAGVLGLIRYRGELAVALDARARFGLPPKAPSIEDHMIIVRARGGGGAAPSGAPTGGLRDAGRLMAIVVDRVHGLLEADESSFEAAPVPLRHVQGLLTLPSGVVFVHDVAAAFSLDEEAQLDAALAAATGEVGATGEARGAQAPPVPR